MVHDLTQGEINKTLFLFALPIVAGMLLQTAFSIVDAFFVGMLGPIELAAISIVFPISFFFIAVSSGLGSGTNALISQAVGEKNLKKASSIAEHSVIFAIIFGVVVGAIAIVLAPTLFVAMGADKQLLFFSMEYAVPIFAGAVFTFLWFVSDAILRAQGNSKTPMKNLAIAVALNAILDPFFIFGIGPFPKWGLFGAAIVTVFADALAAVLNFRDIYCKKPLVCLAFKKFKPNFEHVKAIFLIGFPASLSQVLSSIGFMALTGIVGAFGSFAIAAYGIGMRVNSIAILPSVGIEAAMASFAGQNFGAKNTERIKKASLFGVQLSFVISATVSIILMLFSEQITRLFTSDKAVIAIGKDYLSIVPIAFIIFGLYFAVQGAFEGVGKTKLVLLTNAMYWIVVIVLAIFLSKAIGLKGIWFAIVAGATTELIMVAIIFNSNIWLKTKAKN